MNINATLLGQSIAFFLFAVFCMKFIWPPVVQALRERQKKIAEGLAAGERGHHEQELARERAKGELREAKGQAAEIVAQAQKRGNVIIDEAKDQARVEGERLLTAAKAEVEREVNRAREQLREQVASLAVAGAEKILRREIDVATNQDILDSVASQL